MEEPIMNLYEEQIQKIISLLESSFNAKSGIEQKRAEDQLNTFINCNEDFLIILLQISSRREIQDSIRMSACQFIGTAMRLKLPDSPQSDKVKWSELLMESLREPGIELKNKFRLSHSLSLIASSSKDTEIRIAIFSKVLELLNVKERQFSIAGLLGLQVIVQTVDETQYLYKIFDAIELTFCETAEFFIKPLQQIFASQIKESHPPVLSQLASTSVVESLNILTLWSQTLKKIVGQFLSKQNSSHALLVQKVLTSEKVAQTVFQLFNLNAYERSQQEQNSFLKNCLISMTGVEEVDEGLNELKGLLAETIRNLLYFTFEKRPKMTIEGNYFFKQLSILLPSLLQSLHNFCSQQKYRQEMNFQNTIENSSFVNKLLNSLLKFISLAAQQMEFYPLFQQNLESLLVGIVFPLASSAPSEINLLTECPEDFISIQEDCCEKQLDQNYKCAAFMLLESLVDFIDGSLNSVCIYAIGVAQFALNCKSTSEINQRFPQINCFKDSLFLQCLGKEVILETALLIICNLQYKLEEREDLLESFQSLLIDNFLSLSNSNLQDIVKCRIACMMSVYYDKIFWHINHMQIYEQYVLLIFSYLNKQQSPVVQLSAIKALDSMYYDQKYSQRLVSTLNQAIQLILSNLPHIDSPIYMDLIYQITMKFSHIIKDNQAQFTSILEGISNKILQEYQSVLKGESKSTLCLNKGMSIFKGICENKNYVPTFVLTIEQIIKGIIVSMHTPIDTSFEDDLLLIILSIIKQTLTISDLTKATLPLFPAFFKKSNGVLSNMFQVLNYVFVYGTEYFQQNPQLFQDLTEICIMALFTQKTIECQCNDADRAQGATLLQVIIQTFGTGFSPQFWSVLTQKLLEKLLSKEKKEPFLQTRILNVILMGLASQFDAVQENIVNCGKMEWFLKEILVKGFTLSKSGQQYDRKIMIVCLSQILAQEPQSMCADLLNKCSELLKLSILLLIQQKREEEKALAKQENKNYSKSKKKKLGERDDSSEGDWGSDSDEDSSDSDSQNGSDLDIGSFKGDITESQEMILEDRINMRNMLNPLKKSMIQPLPQDVITSLQNVLGMERIETKISSSHNGEENQSSVLIPRKIVKAKRKNNNQQISQQNEGAIIQMNNL